MTAFQFHHVYVNRSNHIGNHIGHHLLQGRSNTCHTSIISSLQFTFSSSLPSQRTFFFTRYRYRSTVIHPLTQHNKKTSHNSRISKVNHLNILPKMTLDPWTVSSQNLEAIAGPLFAVSLFPYLAFLHYLAKPAVKCPKLALNGFRFLLVFVFATIPAGIYAKNVYHEILANIDYLHGGAESLLTITNLLITLGFRQVFLQATRNNNNNTDDENSQQTKTPKLRSPFLVTSLALASTLVVVNNNPHSVAESLPTLLLSLGVSHPEPWNALSIPTWVVHVSSVIEWLIAMGLVWDYADYTKNQAWKGLTWGMLPLHSSGLIACTYHIFYNHPSMSILVLLQAALTVVGNITCAIASYRLWKKSEALSVGAPIYALDDTRSTPQAPTQDPRPTSWSSFSPSSSSSSDSAPRDPTLVGWEDVAEAWGNDSNLFFVGKLMMVSLVGAYIIKYGELFLDFPFDPSLIVAAAMIGVPSALNIAKWYSRSRATDVAA